jgi:histone acetyltransferase (RNA polymerase elongator complex component)
MVFVIPVFIPHRGCPHDCLFCNQQKISGEERSSESTVEVCGIIESWLGRNKKKLPVQVAFFGGSFTCMSLTEQEILLAQVAPYLGDGRVESIRLSTRPDCVDAKICKFLYNHGVRTVELGVQSFDDAVLSKSHRGHSASDSRRSASMIKESGFELGIQLMPGLPGDSWKIFSATLSETIRLQPDFVRIYPTVVVKDSGLEKLYKQGEFRPLSLGRAVSVAAKSVKRFDAAGIEVIRIGLQPSPSLEESVVAGPYHPAFGELVQSRLWFLKFRRELNALADGKNLEIQISHRDLSAAIGMKKRNTHLPLRRSISTP